jgi:uncharacterized protein (DUF433 family)
MASQRNSTLLSRITVEAGKRSGQPCIRGLRITVADVIGWHKCGMSDEEILSDYPELEQDDLEAAYAYTAQQGREDKRA